MKLHFFILFFVTCSLLFHFPSDFEAFAATSDGSVDSTVEINDSNPVPLNLSDEDKFGLSVANIGDLDGDGVNDLLVGAYGDDNQGADRGAVLILFMNTDGSVKSKVKIKSSTTNGPVLQDNDNFGTSVESISDLNGDGVDDFIIGAWKDDGGSPTTDSGNVAILYPDTDGSLVKAKREIKDTTANGPTLSEDDRFGSSVANMGDLNGDGFDDLAIGATKDDAGGDDRGAVHIIYMANNGFVSSSEEINSNTANGPDLSDDDRFGRSVENIGDLDGDGVNDLAVGAERDDMDENGDDSGGTDRGAVHILFMNSDATVKSTVEINDSTANGPDLSDDDRFGRSVENIGDFDGDGVNDLAVGAHLDDGNGNFNRGAVHILFMNTDGSVKSTVEINDSTANGPTLSDRDQFGHSIANMGDLNVDGTNDLAVGAHLDDAGGSGRGAVHIMFMHETTKPTVTITSSSGDSDSTVSSDTLSYTATFSESVSNFVVGDITVTGTANGGSPEASNFAGSGTTYTFDVVQGSSDGTVSVSIAAGVATDAAGNENTVSNTYTLTIGTATASSTCSRHVILGNCGTITINNDEYRIINTWTNVPTTEVLVGQPVTVTLSTPHNYAAGKINSASVYTEIFDLAADYELGSHLDYSIMKSDYYVSEPELFQVSGATHRIVQDPDVKNLEMFEVVFTMIFAKPMDTSHVVVETKNKHGIPETLYLLDALKVNENLAQALTLEEKSKFSIVDPEPEMDPEPEIEMDPEPEQTKKEKSKRQRR